MTSARRRTCAALGVLLVAAAACDPGASAPPPTGTMPDPDTPRTLLALGDSYTIGEGVAPADRWPVVLAERLSLDAPRIVARTGWTVAELDAGIDADAPAGPFGLVTLLIGVNDEYRGGSLDAYRPAFQAMLARAIGFANGDPARVVVVSIPDWSVTPFGAANGRPLASIATRIDAFNAVARDEASRAGARWADVTGLSRTTATGTVDDGLHPDAAAYRAWSGAIAREARAALRLHADPGTARVD